MSNQTNTIAEAMRMLGQPQAASQAGLAGPIGQPGQPGRAAKPVDPKMLAFQAEMQMARQAMAVAGVEPAPQENSSFGADMGMFSDMMLMDALSTIQRLTGEGATQQKAAPAPADEAELAKSLTRNPSASGSEGLGALAARFESGEKGVEAIGFDRTGGTSYGKFQISSRAGTMNRFLDFLAEREPGWASRLRASGPANTGSTRGRMPAEWVKIAHEDAAKFEKLQHEFIKKDHYQPAREKILARTGVDLDAARPAVREALFSTAVQHGASGAARIFNAAIDKFLKKPEAAQAALPGVKSFEQALVSEVYSRRGEQFGGSNAAVRNSVRGRLKQEKDIVLAMLDKKGVDRLA